MSAQYRTPTPAAQERDLADHAHRSLSTFLAPLLQHLDDHLDARLVRTFRATIVAILVLRHRAYGLLLSELGGYLLPPQHAPAGTKRLSNLLRSPKWAATVIHQFLWQQAQLRVTELAQQDEEILVVWDESVLEKAESHASEGLCAVRSSKAARLKRINPGFFNPPGGRPIQVPGLHWLGLLVLGHAGPPTVAAMQWWTTCGPRASDRRREEQRLLHHCQQTWGRQVRHVWDRGFAGRPWLTHVLDRNLCFVLRWPKRYKLLDRWAEERKAWEIARGKRSWDLRWLHDRRSGARQKVGVVALSVTHPRHARPLWLVFARPGKGHEPWYLLTSDRIETAADAWQVVHADARRWQIEMSWRYNKTELAMESPRLWTWERREKLLLLVTLAYAFLRRRLMPTHDVLRDDLWHQWCHRTGKRSRAPPTPLYRLRSALSRLWLAYNSPSLQSSG